MIPDHLATKLHALPIPLFNGQKGRRQEEEKAVVHLDMLHIIFNQRSYLLIQHLVRLSDQDHVKAELAMLGKELDLIHTTISLLFQRTMHDAFTVPVTGIENALCLVYDYQALSLHA